MAAAGLLALLDDIATLLDDVALLSKVAAKKTAGVVGDDLALNAKQVAGIRAERELPVVWAVTKGSLKNKLIIVPVALLLSAFTPWLITPLLILGGLYLCYEGVEKIVHSLCMSQSDKQFQREKIHQALIDDHIDLLTLEREKIKGAIRTDFILSAEIVVIALGAVRDVEFLQQVVVVSLIALVITLAVYGSVAAIVKLDDLGFYLQDIERSDLLGRSGRWFGEELVNFCPYLMKGLAIAGTAAMFLVGGGILVHGMTPLHDTLHYLALFIDRAPLIHGLPEFIYSGLYSMFCGVVAGAVVLLLLQLGKRILSVGEVGQKGS